MNEQLMLKLLNDIRAPELEALSLRVAELLKLENTLYGRTFKSLYHILGFMSAANVSTAEVKSDSGEWEPLDKRTDKPDYKDSELIEAARELNKLHSLPDIVAEDLIHVLSETGDVLWNLLQIYNLPDEQLPNAQYVRNGIAELYTTHEDRQLIQLLSAIAITKFEARYELFKRKAVNEEELLLGQKYGAMLRDLVDAYGGVANLLTRIRLVIMNILAKCIDVASFEEVMLLQMLGAAEVLRTIKTPVVES